MTLDISITDAKDRKEKDIIQQNEFKAYLFITSKLDTSVDDQVQSCKTASFKSILTWCTVHLSHCKVSSISPLSRSQFQVSPILELLPPHSSPKYGIVVAVKIM